MGEAPCSERATRPKRAVTCVSSSGFLDAAADAADDRVHERDRRGGGGLERVTIVATGGLVLDRGHAVSRRMPYARPHAPTGPEVAVELFGDAHGERVAALGSEGRCREVRDPAAGLVAGAQRDDDVGLVPVGLVGEGRVGPPGAEQHAGARRQQPSSNGGTEAGELGVGRDVELPAPEPAGIAAQRFAFTNRGRGAVGQRADLVETEERGPAALTVDGQPEVELKFAQSAFSLGTEDAVLAPSVKTEHVQPALEGCDVVAADERPAQVEEPVTELVAALDERVPRLRAAHAVDAQAPLDLELADRVLRIGVEPVGLAGQTAEPRIGERLAQLGHGAPVAPARSTGRSLKR